MVIRALSQDNRAVALRILSSHPECYGKLNCKKDISWLFASQMFEVVEDGVFVAMFGINRFNRFNNGFDPENVLCCVYVKKAYRKKGIFNKIVEFVIEKTKQDMVDLGKVVHLTINAEPKNELAKSVYNHKFTFLEYNKKQKLYWWEIY